MRYKILTLAVAVVSHLGFAQEINTAKLDAYFKALEENQKMMGSVIIAKEGNPIYTKSVGFANVEKGIKNDENTRFRIGSITKTFTAVLVLKAVEEGRLNLDDKLSKFYPKIKNSEKISIEHLLYHRSGIFSITNDKNYFDWRTKPKTEQEIIKMIENYQPVFEPDTQFEYSNSNYTLLSYILQKLYKKSYADLVESKISKPLKLKNTQVGGEISKDNEAKSYYFEDNSWKLEPETHLSYVLGAGAISSTIFDLVAFHQGLFGGKLLKKESLDKMKEEKDNYGMGIYMIPFEKKKAYSHNGGIDGFSSILATFLDEKITYVRLSNATNIVNNNVDIAVLSAVFGKEFDIPDFSKKDIKIDDNLIKNYEGTYASESIPLKILIFREGEKLMAQATGQSAFPLENITENSFRFDAAGIVIEFPENGKMILKQGGGIFRFEKEK